MPTIITDGSINEFVLKQDTTYAMRITGAGVTDNGVASIKLNWYEHTDRD